MTQPPATATGARISPPTWKLLISSPSREMLHSSPSSEPTRMLLGPLRGDA